MQALVTSGEILVLILALTVFEAVALTALHRYTRHGIAPKNFLPSLLAGDFLILAWLADRHDLSWLITAACLLAALLSHLTDLARRWRLPR
jgi:hypothetical protein